MLMPGRRHVTGEVAVPAAEQRIGPAQVDDVLPEPAGSAGGSRGAALEADRRAVGQRRQVLDAQAEQVPPGRRVTPEAHPVTRVDDPGASDLMAVGAIGALRAAGRRVPADVAVVGFDHSAAATMVEPALTTMRNPIEQTALQALRILDDQIDGRVRPPVHVLLSSELAERPSA